MYSEHAPGPSLLEFTFISTEKFGLSLYEDDQGTRGAFAPPLIQDVAGQASELGVRAGDLLMAVNGIVTCPAVDRATGMWNGTPTPDKGGALNYDQVVDVMCEAQTTQR